MKLLNFIFKAVYFIVADMASTGIASSLRTHFTARPNGISNVDHNNRVAADGLHRNRRSTSDECFVHPDTPVMLNGKETYFDFDYTQRQPAALPGEHENMKCPNTSIEQHNVASMTYNYRSVCPWKWITVDYWNNEPGYEVYPRFVMEARCLCHNCIVNETLGCKNLFREYTFYRKTGCNGTKPVFASTQLDVIVGCYCEKQS